MTPTAPAAPAPTGTRPDRLGWHEIDEIRRCPGRSTLLFITDRCPVGCAHCSVDSRRDSPMITDHRLFEDIVDWICAQDSFEVVGVSGGEPFVERRGLTLASERIVAASSWWCTRPACGPPRPHPRSGSHRCSSAVPPCS